MSLIKKINFRQISIILILTFLFLEIFSCSYLNFVRGVRPIERKQMVQELQKNQLIGSSWNLRYYPHPFFGYVAEPGLGNNFGFLSKHDFPIQKTKDQIIIGIFGGSVASGIGYLVESQAQYYERYIKDLHSEWRGKEIIFVNFAMGGYRQPQQYFVASYFAEMVDIALFLDGANDLSANPYPKYPLNFPKLTYRFFSSPGEDYWKKKKIQFFRKTHSSLVNWLADHDYLLNSSSVYLAFVGFDNIAKEQVIRLSDSMIISNKLKALQTSNPSSFLTEDQQTEELIKNWIKYFKLSHLIFSTSNKLMISFIQPSQYVEDSKIFTDEELNSAIDRSGYYPTLFAPRVTALSQRAKSLADSGYPVCDFTRLYKGITETIFIDNFCHVNRVGEIFLLKSMLSSLIQSIKSKKNVCVDGPISN